MNFVQFKNSLRDFPLFSIADIRAAHGDFDRRRLSEWQKKGYIKKIIKDLEPFVYSKKEVDRVRMFPDFVRQAI
jgi:hypothetical protein